MRLRPAVYLTFLTLTAVGGAPALQGASGRTSGGVLGTAMHDVAAPLRDLWLHFHEDGLCAGLDTIFVFRPKGVEIWCRIKDEKSYQGLNALIESLQRSFQIDLYATHPSREKKPFSLDDNDPLPSLWNNGELRLYLGEPSIPRLRSQNLADPESSDFASANADPALKRRMKLFGDDILELTAKMEQLAGELPPLAAAGYGADIMPDIRERARIVSVDHAREVGRCAAKLADNIGHALPRGSGAASPARPPEKVRSASNSPYDLAVNLSAQASALAQRIRNFLYPQAYTVDLADLKDRGLVEALKSLQAMASGFQSSTKNAR